MMNKKGGSSKSVTEIIKEGYEEGKAREELNSKKGEGREKEKNT